MDEFWATRTGRWRVRLKGDHEGTLGERLYRLVCLDIDERLLPAGAIMPGARRVADELNIDEAAVNEAYRALQRDGLLVDRPGAGLCIASRDSGDRPPGDETQVRFEKNLLATARRAADHGMSARDASGIFPRPRIKPDADQD